MTEKLLWAPERRAILVDVPELTFLMADGTGDPQSAEFQGAVQTLHVGPFAEEDRAVALLAAYADDHGYQLAGRHHEIYLTDPRRTPPERLHTIVRHPLAHASSLSTWSSVSPTAGSVRTSIVGA